MKSFLSCALAFTVLAMFTVPVFADVTPMEQDIPELKPTTITCMVPEAQRIGPSSQKIPAGLPANIRKDLEDQEAARAERIKNPPEYHYIAYLPAGYKANDKREYPVLWLTSPGGGANPVTYKNFLAREQMIGIGLTESKNGPWDPIIENNAAANADVMKRFRMANGFRISTGFSGGARAASLFALDKAYGGVLLQGAGLSGLGSFTKENPTCYFYGLFGIGDGNTKEADMLATGLPKASIRRFSLQSGNHAPAQLPAFDEGLNFLLDAIYTTRPNPDPNAMAQYVIRFRILTERAKGASGLEKYEALEFANRIAIARKFATDKALASNKDLLAEVADVARQLADLGKDPAVAAELDARTAFRKVRDVEDSKWPASARDLTAFAKQCAPNYDAVANKYPDALYGKKAADRAAWLAKGVEKDAGKGGGKGPEKD